MDADIAHTLSVSTCNASGSNSSNIAVPIPTVHFPAPLNMTGSRVLGSSRTSSGPMSPRVAPAPQSGAQSPKPRKEPHSSASSHSSKPVGESKESMQQRGPRRNSTKLQNTCEYHNSSLASPSARGTRRSACGYSAQEGADPPVDVGHSSIMVQNGDQTIPAGNMVEVHATASSSGVLESSPSSCSSLDSKQGMMLKPVH